MAVRPERLVAHTPPEGSARWHYLDEHSLEVAALAAEFAEPFGGQDVARWLGLLHDAGKAHPDFQDYLWQCAQAPDRRHHTVDHKTAGAAALSSAPDLPQVLLGHHGGLSDLSAVTSKMRDAVTTQRDRLSEAWRRFLTLDIVPEAPLRRHHAGPCRRRSRTSSTCACCSPVSWMQTHLTPSGTGPLRRPIPVN